tara:strand:- start:189 stop:434 length:246 start_codon:yes stop_codon:yes gene_type:complete
LTTRSSWDPAFTLLTATEVVGAGLAVVVVPAPLLAESPVDAVSQALKSATAAKMLKNLIRIISPLYWDFTLIIAAATHAKM